MAQPLPRPHSYGLPGCGVVSVPEEPGVRILEYCGVGGHMRQPLLQPGRFARQPPHPVRTEAVPLLNALAQETLTNANLAVLDGTDVVYVHRVPSPQVPDPYVHTGGWAPNHCTAVGKVLLAFAPQAVIDRVAGAVLRPLTPATITDGQALAAHLDDIRAQGYAGDNEEYMRGTYCIAGPVRDATGSVVAAISLSSTNTLLERNEVVRHADHLLRIYSQLSYKLGFGLFQPASHI